MSKYRDKLLEFTSGDERLTGELIDLFIEHYPGILANMDDAISKHDPNELRMAAHKLKGELGSFGAEIARDLTVTMETMAVNDDLSDADKVMSKLRPELKLLKEALDQDMRTSVL